MIVEALFNIKYTDNIVYLIYFSIIYFPKLEY